MTEDEFGHTLAEEDPLWWDMQAALNDLVVGIEAWAADEDGVHPDCWDAYRRACAMIDKSARPQMVEQLCDKIQRREKHFRELRTLIDDISKSLVDD